MFVLGIEIKEWDGVFLSGTLCCGTHVVDMPAIVYHIYSDSITFLAKDDKFPGLPEHHTGFFLVDVANITDIRLSDVIKL